MKNVYKVFLNTLRWMKGIDPNPDTLRDLEQLYMEHKTHILINGKSVFFHSLFDKGKITLENLVTDTNILFKSNRIRMCYLLHF